MNLVLQRERPKSPGWPIPGKLTAPPGNNIAMPTLEDPYIYDKQRSDVAWPYTGIKLPGVTAIPAGRYRLSLVKSTRFGRYLPAVCDVPGFTGILFHAGNWQEDTQGCILVGLSMFNLRQLTDSAKAIDALVAWLDARTEATWIEVKNPVTP